MIVHTARSCLLRTFRKSANVLQSTQPDPTSFQKLFFYAADISAATDAGRVENDTQNRTPIPAFGNSLPPSLPHRSESVASRDRAGGCHEGVSIA